MDFYISDDVAVKPHKRHWQFCVGNDHAHTVLRTDTTRMLAFLHQELGIERVRFHGIFNDDMQTRSSLSSIPAMAGSPWGEEFSEQSFQQIGVAYDNVLSAGMKPFVELGFMPQALASGNHQMEFFYGGNVTPPADYQAWEKYIEDFIRFLQHRYGKAEIRTWYFEVWNEPDIGFFSGGQPEYLELYEHTARAIKRVDPCISVGGPATSGSKWVHTFVKHCKANGIPLDFVSTHQYSGDPLTGVKDSGSPEDESEPISGEVPEEMNYYAEEYGRQIMERMAAVPIEKRSFLNGWRMIMPDKTELEDTPSDVFAKNAAIVRRQAEGLPLFYTEWNYNAIFGCESNDTRKAAAYNIRAILETDENIDGSSIWCSSDIFEEFHYFPEEFHGGFGLLTHSGIPKPTFYVLKMLMNAGDLRLELGETATKGEVGIAVFQKEDSMQILLFRQKMRQLDLPKEPVTITVRIKEAPAGIFVQRIDEEHCNPLRVWKQMGMPSDLNRAEIKSIIAASTLQEEPWDFIFDKGLLTIQAELSVNDIYLFNIIKTQ